VLRVRGAAGPPTGGFPVSVKTRLGFRGVDLSWHEFLLKQKLNALTIHGRTAKQLSSEPADWTKINEIRKLRDSLSPSTKIVGNGDVMTRQQGKELAQKFQLDGIMIGRGIFHDPFVFATKSTWSTYTGSQKADLYRHHIELFASTWKNNERKHHTLNKFCKVYINGFDGAKELREKLMQANTTDELLALLERPKVYNHMR
jgi:tRNA-dihydrouridine synthase